MDTDHGLLSRKKPPLHILPITTKTTAQIQKAQTRQTARMSYPQLPRAEQGSQGFAENTSTSVRNSTTEKTAANVPSRTLSPISTNPMNQRYAAGDPKLPIASQYVAREQHDITKSFGQEGPATRVGLGTSDSATMPTSTSRLNGATPVVSHARTSPTSRLGNIPMTSSVRNISAEFGGSRALTNGFPIAEDNTAESNGQQWSSAVGKANTGKSGQFIEKITKENDMLKRDVQIFKLQADEAKNELKMAGLKMDQQIADWEIRLLNAKANETLLARRDRQLEESREQIAREKHRANVAVESERNWREQMERTEYEAFLKVEEATTYANLQEGRNKILTSHWDDQKKEVNDMVMKLGKDISEILEKRREDVERMNALQALCEQQRFEVDNLRKQKDAIDQAFVQYKIEKERSLEDIMQKAAEQEKDHEETLEKAKDVLGQLKWALAVHENVRDANTK